MELIEGKIYKAAGDSICQGCIGKIINTLNFGITYNIKVIRDANCPFCSGDSKCTFSESDNPKLLSQIELELYGIS